MCYSGMCLYESHTGECRVIHFEKIKDLTGKTACYIGGFCENAEADKEYIKDLQNGVILKYQDIITQNKLSF